MKCECHVVGLDRKKLRIRNLQQTGILSSKLVFFIIVSHLDKQVSLLWILYIMNW